jgi:hypothetical protein
VTVPGRGYRFEAEVAEASVEEADEAELVIEKRTAARIVIEDTTEGPAADGYQPRARCSPQAAVALAQRPNRKSLAVSALALTLLGAAAIYFWLRPSPRTSRIRCDGEINGRAAIQAVAVDKRDEALNSASPTRSSHA